VFNNAPLLSVTELSKSYGTTHALRGVSFAVKPATTLALVGASGSGKSTLARCLAGLETPTGGSIQFAGEPLEIQLIFQQPAASLNPRFTAAEIVEEPLLIQRRGDSPARRERAAQALELVGIARAALGKYAHQFSGGEQQRLAIARALALEPKLLILDESLNGLDPALVAQIGALLTGLQSRLALTYILISHDLELVAGLATDIAVMQAGLLVECGPAAAILTAPQHPQTRELLAATRILSAGRLAE
jgi:ABC-type glutathione transport system ATPase component